MSDDDPFSDPADAPKKADGQPQKVPDRDVSAFREAHAKLYGLLLIANERIERSPGRLGWWMTAGWGALCFALIAEAPEEVFGFRLSSLQSGWTYGISMILFLMTFFRLQRGTQRRAYRKAQADITADTSRAGLTQATLLTAIEGHAALAQVASEIKADDAFDRRRR
jgi:hypothetical protein